MEDIKESGIDRGCENGGFTEREVTISTSESGIYFISKADGEVVESIEDVEYSLGSRHKMVITSR
jgi:hypothetical protein